MGLSSPSHTDDRMVALGRSAALPKSTETHHLMMIAEGGVIGSSLFRSSGYDMADSRIALMPLGGIA
jgi:amino acid permease